MLVISRRVAPADGKAEGNLQQSLRILLHPCGILEHGKAAAFAGCQLRRMPCTIGVVQGVGAGFVLASGRSAAWCGGVNTLSTGSTPLSTGSTPEYFKSLSEGICV